MDKNKPMQRDADKAFRSRMAGELEDVVLSNLRTHLTSSGLKFKTEKEFREYIKTKAAIHHEPKTNVLYISFNDNLVMQLKINLNDLI